MRAPKPLALILGLSLAAGSAAAQTSTTAPAPATAPATTPTTPWGAKPVGKYALIADVDGSPRNAMLTLTTDSTGRTRGVVTTEAESHDMTVTVKEPDLVMETDTPDGTMTIILQRHGDAITGKWARGMGGGAIKGSPAP